MIRHSGSDRAEIRVRSERGIVDLQVRDFGKDISPERLGEIREHGSGVGIRGTRERVRQFQGDMQIESSNSGTTVRVTLPVPSGSVLVTA